MLIMLKDLMLENNIIRHNENYNTIMNGKSFYDQTIDPDIKRNEEIRKLTTGQGVC